MDLFSQRTKFYIKKPSLYKLEKKGFNAAFFQQLTSPYFTQLTIDTIIDVGANEGQSTLTFRLAFPQSTIYAFEPLPECFAKLKDNLAEYSNVVLHNLALGDKSGEILFEQNEYSASSSALNMSEKHVENFPYTKNKKQVSVQTKTLDEVFVGKTDLGNVLMKIDVQGYEKHVILGGIQTLCNTQLLIVETSFETLYNGQPLFGEIYETVCALGFVYAGSFDQLNSPRTGKVLQQDAMFVRLPKSQ